MRRGLAFLSDGRPLDYGARLSRLRWARTARAQRVADWRASDSAEGAVEGAEVWTLVSDAAVLPFSPREGSLFHTLRELENAPRGTSETEKAAAVAFRPADFPPGQGETVEGYVSRLLSGPPPEVARLPVFSVGDPSERERPEVVNRLPTGSARILDAGCGKGGLALAKARRPGWKVTGVERDLRQAATARQRCDRVLEGDLAQVLPRLAARAEIFEAIVFADVLEHLDDPVAALSQARRLAAPGGILVAVVPNVGHLSLVRDLLYGRHDPVPAGLCDAGHLRWFTRSSLRESIEEAGWSVESIAAEPGAPAPDPAGFLALAAEWPDADREGLLAYQWIATARAR